MTRAIPHGAVGVISASGNAIIVPPVLALITTLYSCATILGAPLGPEEAVSIPSKVTIHTRPISALAGSTGNPALAAPSRFKSCNSPSMRVTRVAFFKSGSPFKATASACPPSIAPCARGSEVDIGTNSSPTYFRFCGVAARSGGCFCTSTAGLETICQIKKPLPPTITMPSSAANIMTPTCRLLMICSFFSTCLAPAPG